MSLKMAFIAMLWTHEKLHGGRRINKHGKIFTILDISSQGQIDGKCSSLGLTAFKWPLYKAWMLKFNVQGAPGGRARVWWEQLAVTAAGITGVPSSRCWESSSSQRGSSCPPSHRSYAAFHFWPGLTSIYCFFGSKLMLLGCRSTSQDGFFHWERSHKWRTTSYGQSMGLGRFILN